MSRVKHPNVAATICELVVSVIVAMPVTFVAARLISEGARGAETMRTMVGLYPMLAEKRLRMHTLIAFISTVQIERRAAFGASRSNAGLGQINSTMLRL